MNIYLIFTINIHISLLKGVYFNYYNLFTEIPALKACFKNIKIV